VRGQLYGHFVRSDRAHAELTHRPAPKPIRDRVSSRLKITVIAVRVHVRASSSSSSMFRSSPRRPCHIAR
jgi:hypothetical protein